MAQTSQFLTLGDITREGMRILKNNLSFTRGVRRDLDNRYGKTGAKIGYTANVRKPPRYIGRTGAAISVEATTETYVPVTLTTQFGVDISVSSADMTLSLNDYAEIYLKPAMATIANKIDYDGLQLYKQIHNVVGTPGTISGGGLTAAQASGAIMAANARMAQEAAPLSDRMALWEPQSAANIVVGFQGLFNPTGVISKVFQEGALGDNILGLDHAMSQNVPMHTSGTLVSASVTVNGAHAGGSVQADATTAYTVSIAGHASNSYTLKAGDVITFANVYAVNPQSRQSTGVLKNFVVQSDVTLTTSANTNISVLPYPVFSGAYQNVTSTSNTIASGAAVTPVNFSGTTQYANNMVWHRDAFVLAMADLEMPDAKNASASIAQSEDGFSLRLVKFFDGRTDQNLARLDVLYGWKCLYPELACRIVS